MASRTARIRNWKQYEAGLIQRGSISFWINDDAIDQWNPEVKDKTRGRQEEYSDLAIQICLTFRLLYRQSWRCCTKIFWNRVPHFSCFLPNSYGI